MRNSAFLLVLPLFSLGCTDQPPKQIDGVTASQVMDLVKTDLSKTHDDGSELVRSERAAEALIASGIEADRARLAPYAPRLVPDPDLTNIARQRSEAMAHGAPFSHQDERGRFAAADMVRRRFGPYGTIGENILVLEMWGSQVFDAADFAKSAVSSWMTSPGHRANILSPNYRSSGIGVAINGGYAYVTEVFRGSPKELPSPLADSTGTVTYTDRMSALGK
jgi:hypothetical protein